MTPSITRIRAVEIGRGYADIDITPTPGQQTHRIGHLAGEGWWCAEPCNSKRCRWIQTARELVPDMEDR